MTAATAIPESRLPVFGRIERMDGATIDLATMPLPDGATLVTFSDVTASVRMERALTERTGRETTLVTGTTRPVPLDFHYVFSPVHETIEELLDDSQLSDALAQQARQLIEAEFDTRAQVVALQEAVAGSRETQDNELEEMVMV